MGLHSGYTIKILDLCIPLSPYFCPLNDDSDSAKDGGGSFYSYKENCHVTLDRPTAFSYEILDI